ncbi:MAG TPA: serine protease [Promineifilum sp.]|nr:serine protease [Promineifilum sp.]
MLRLEGPEIIELRDILMRALSLQELEDVLLRLNTSVSRIIIGRNEPEIYREVVVHFNRRTIVDQLVVVAHTVNPTDPNLYLFMQGHGLAMEFPAEATDLPGIEAIIRKHLGTLDARTWIERAAAAENRVCLISYGGQPRGTGFLVGPEAVLTNYHVVRNVVEGADPAGLGFRFDFMFLPDGALGGAGAPLGPVLPDWLIDHSPPYPSDDPLMHPKTPINPRTPPDVPPDHLDYALLRVAGRPGDAVVGAKATPDGRGQPRGWLQLRATPHDFAAAHALLVLHHPDGQPLQLSIDTDSFAAVNTSRTRIYHRSNTDYGSSGSPVFDLGWNLVALHQGRGTVNGELLNRAIPVSAIHALLAQHEKLGALGG